MALVANFKGRGSTITTKYNSQAVQSSITYTASDEQDVVVFANFSVYSGTSTVTVQGTTVFSATSGDINLFASENYHLNSGDTVVANGNSSQWLYIATNGTGTIA